MTTGKFITVLDAIHWIFSSIKDVKKQTVSSCFRKAGFPGVETEEHDPEDNMPLSELITAASKQLKIRDPMTAEEFVNTDKYVSVTEELGENWEKELVVEDFINNQNPDQDDENLPDSKQRRVKQKKNVPLKTSQAIKMSRQLKLFSLKKGLTNSYSDASTLEGEYH